MTEERKMITDMNARERERFIESFQMMTMTIEQMIVALQGDDDIKLIWPSMAFMNAFLNVKDLFDIISEATWVDVSDLDYPIEPEDRGEL